MADVKLWESYIDEWGDTYRDELVMKASPKSVIGYDMGGHQQELTKATEALVQAIEDAKIFHTDHKMLNRHVRNARRRPNKVGCVVRQGVAGVPEEGRRFRSYAVGGYGAQGAAGVAGLDEAAEEAAVDGQGARVRVGRWVAHGGDG
ncbi:hypothetical protein [Streptomyces sp. NPDC057740]|uniref:hypothetical protein n=1 Tax=Streptomyces sp. NPDC057740 TaxID=3346234 RepID=UPI0036A564AA